MPMRHLVIAVLALLFVSPSARAQDARILLERSVEAQPTGNFVQTVRLTATSKNGKEKVRELEMRTRSTEDHVLVRGDVTAPEGMAGTRFALDAVEGESAQMMVFLPAVGTIMHMSGDKRRGSFLGTDFSFEDLEPVAIDMAHHEVVEETPENWIIDTTPGQGSDSAYGRVRTTLSKTDLLPRRVRYFDAQDRQVTELEVLEVRNEGGTPMLVRMEMRNLQKGSRTLMEVLSVRLEVPDAELPDAIFTSDGLRAPVPE